MKKSLEEVNASVDTNKRGFRRILAFLGPAYMISVGYMDPGNWATDIAGGSQFGYSLIWVLIMSNLIALLLQGHCARLGVVTGKDLAQASRESYPPIVNLFLYGLAEIAIAACDLAEVIGMAIGIHLLFPSVSILMGVCITVLDSFILLFLMNKGIRKLEAFIISLIGLIGVSFLIELLIAKPSVSDIAKGIIPVIENEDALYIAIGIIGATVMPHNLYLHSSLVQTRAFGKSEPELKKAIRFNILDSAVALNLALFVNAAILILSAATFFKAGRHDVVDILDAHQLLAPMLGSGLAPLLFAIALIAAGQSSTITGTLAGQVVMEGYLNLRLTPWVRRLITRLIAIVPAFFVILISGEQATGKLLIFSQVVLSLQLGFAIVPLIHFVSDKNRMGVFVIPLWQKILSWVAASIILVLNIKLVYSELSDFTSRHESIWLNGLIFVFLLVCAFILGYVIFAPFISRHKLKQGRIIHSDWQPLTIEKRGELVRMAVAVDFGPSDNKAINKAIQMGGEGAVLVLIHVLESAGAVIYGDQAQDREREEDIKLMRQYEVSLTEAGIRCETHLGFGDPKKAIPNLVYTLNCDSLFMGMHGHKTVKDLLFGTTIESVRHNVKVPLVLV
jgi:manganese transport protein